MRVTKIPNSLADNILKARLSNIEMRLILYVCRYTFGEGKEVVKHPLPYISRIINRHYNNVSYALNKLVKRGILTRQGSHKTLWLQISESFLKENNKEY